MGYGKRKQKQMGTYGTGGFLMVSDTLRESTAYRALTSTQKLVLFDVMRLYMRLSRFDREPLTDGFCYAFTNCRELIDETSFYDARKRLVEIGFLERRDDMKRLTPGAPDVFSASSKWMHYQPSAAEAARLQSMEQRKQRSLERGQARKRLFIEKHPQRRKGKTK